MHMKKNWQEILSVTLFLVAQHCTSALANAENGYLTYTEPAANSTATSLSTISYVFSLLLTFAIVVGLAYFTSKFLSQRLSPTMQSRMVRIHDIAALGPNKSLYLVEIGNRIFLLGVTEHNITYLQEFTDEQFITELRAKNSDFTGQTAPAFQNVFQQQIDTLQQMADRISGGRKAD